MTTRRHNKRTRSGKDPYTCPTCGHRSRLASPFLRFFAQYLAEHTIPHLHPDRDSITAPLDLPKIHDDPPRP